MSASTLTPREAWEVWGFKMLACFLTALLIHEYLFVSDYVVQFFFLALTSLDLNYINLCVYCVYASKKNVSL